MRALFDIQHPAQVHLFKHAIWELQKRGHETLVTSRDKEVTLELLDALEIDHIPLTARRNGLTANVVELAIREVKLFRVARSFTPDVIVSRLGPTTVHVSRLVGCRSVVFTDTNLASTPLGRLYNAITLPFVDVLCAPTDLPVPSNRGTRYNVDFQELAYLHPNRFVPDAAQLAEYDVPTEEQYAVLRLAGWDAYHDVGDRGLSLEATRELVDTLAAHGRVYISSEHELPAEFAPYELSIPPHLVHDLLSFATIYVGDSGTMSSEAAILGTPAVRANTSVGVDDEGIFVDLEATYGLLYSVADERAAIERVRHLLDRTGLKQEWQRKRETFLADMDDVTELMVDVILAEADTGEGNEVPSAVRRDVASRR